MSLNDRKLARHLGVRAQEVQLPLCQLHISTDRLACGPIMGGRDAPTLFSGYACLYTIDPPVGQFANADPLAQFPDSTAFQVISATKTFEPRQAFYPGHYRVVMNLNPPNSAGLGYYVGFYEFSALAAGGMPVAGAPAIGMGGGSAPFLGHVVRSATGPTAGFFQFPLYAPRPWQMRLFAFGTHADANLGQVSVVVSPLHLLEDGPSAE